MTDEAPARLVRDLDAAHHDANLIRARIADEKSEALKAVDAKWQSRLNAADDAVFVARMALSRLGHPPAPLGKPTPAPEGYLNVKQVLQRLRVCRTTLYHLRTTGDFPKPIRLSQRRVAWLAADLDIWEAARRNR